MVPALKENIKEKMVQLGKNLLMGTALPATDKGKSIPRFIII